VKKLLITFGTLIILTSCGYSSEDECLLKEMQKCDSGSCENQARNYCDAEFPGKKRNFTITKDVKPEIGFYVSDSKVFFGYRKKGFGQHVNICLKREGEKRCLGRTFIHSDYKNYVVSGTKDEYFADYVNAAGEELKKGTRMTVTADLKVGFFEWLFDKAWSLLGFIAIGAGILAIMGIVYALYEAIMNWIASWFEDEDEDEEIEEVEDDADLDEDDDLDELAGLLISGGDEQKAQLESMTKNEIKEWADAYGFNVPSSLSKAEMIEKFITEAEEM